MPMVSCMQSGGVGLALQGVISLKQWVSGGDAGLCDGTSVRRMDSVSLFFAIKASDRSRNGHPTYLLACFILWNDSVRMFAFCPYLLRALQTKAGPSQLGTPDCHCCRRFKPVGGSSESNEDQCT